MRQRLSAILLVTAVFFGSLTIAGCGSLPEDAAVRVNGHVITKDEVATRIDHLRKKLGALVPDESQEVTFSNYRREVTDKLVQEWLEMEETDRRGITVSEEEIDSRFLELAEESYLGYVDQLIKQEALDVGLTEADLRDQVRRDLLHEKLMQDVGKDIVVTDEDARAYYEKNITQYVRPEQRQVRQLITDSEAAAAAAVSRIRAGESFISLVEQISVDPLAQEKKGALNLISPGQLAPELDAAVYRLALGQVSDPVKVGDQWYVVTVENILPPVNNPFETVKEEVRGLYGNQIFAERYRALVKEVYDGADKEYDPDYNLAGRVNTETLTEPQGAAP